MVSPSAKRRAAQKSAENGEGSRSAACRELGLVRSGLYRQAKTSVESRRIRKEVLELSARHPRYGYRRITALWRVKVLRSTRSGSLVSGERKASR